MEPSKRTYVPAAMILAAVLTSLFGYSSLVSSPYTGLRIVVRGDAAVVEAVDAGSPAEGAVFPGDRIAAIDGRAVPSPVFSADPDYLRHRADQRAFWDAQAVLESTVVRSKPSLFLLERSGRPVERSITPGSFSLFRAVRRTAPVYLVAWTFLLVAFIVLKRKGHEISRVNFFLGLFVCLSYLTFAPYSVRDIVFPVAAFRLLSSLNTVFSAAFSYTLFPLILVFPRRKRLLIRRPWLFLVPYAMMGVVLAAHFGSLFENTYVTTYLSMAFCVVLVFGRLLYDYGTEGNLVYRKQIQWVIFGMIAGVTSWFTLTTLPMLLGWRPLSQELSVLPSVIYPLCFAFAVTKYRLMDIDTIFDYSVIYGVTVAVLAGIELTFLSSVSPYLVRSEMSLPAVSLAAVLLIVVIYLPVRNRIRDAVGRLFKRGNYDVEKEVRRFTVALGTCEGPSPLDTFLSAIEKLLGPSGSVVLRIDPDGEPSLLHASGGIDRGDAERLPAAARQVGEHLARTRTSSYGYELLEQGLLDGVPVRLDAENALFVPVFADHTARAKGYVAVLLKKKTDAPYSRKDIVLLSALSVNFASVIEAGEQRRAREEIEERHRREKDSIMRELHDGLGNLLTNIAVASQAVAGNAAADRRVFAAVGRIGDYASEAIDFLRSSLTMLDHPQGSLESALEGLRDRSADLFALRGMELRMHMAEDVRRLAVDAVTTVNIVRSVQEALSNCVKHARAATVTIDVAFHDGVLSLSVTDDGAGFSGRPLTQGYGLRNIQNRMQKIGGETCVRSGTGKGTRIVLMVPIDAKEKTHGHALGDR